MGKREINSLKDSKQGEIIYCSGTKKSLHEEVLFGMVRKTRKISTDLNTDGGHPR